MKDQQAATRPVDEPTAQVSTSQAVAAETSAPQPPSPSPLFRTSFVLVIYSLLTLILTYPLIFNLTTTVPNDIGDPLLNTWILAWDSHTLLTDPLDLFNANIFHPLPNTLAYSEHLFSTALLALPLQLISGEPILAYNSSLLATFPLAAFGMYLLTLRWLRHRGAAFIAGLIFAFNPYRFAAIAHLQLLTFQWLPFAILFLDILLKKGPVSRVQKLGNLRFLALAIFLLLQVLASWYLALYTALILGIYLLAALLTRRVHLSRLLLLISTFLISILLTLPFALPYFSSLDDLRDARPLSLALSLAAVPTDFAAAAPFNFFFGPLTEPLRTRPAFTEENMLFVGLVAPVLVFVSFFYFSRITHHASRITFYALLTILLLSLPLTFPTPYATLATLFPPSTIIRVPPRWIIPALFALSGLAAFGYTIVTYHVSRITYHVSRITYHVSRITPHVSRTILLLTSSLLLTESLSTPLPLAPVENRATLNPAYHWLAQQPDDFALIELPLHSAPAPEFPEVKRLYASTLGWWKLINGYSGYTPSRQPQLAQALAHFPATDSILTLQTLIHAQLVGTSQFTIHNLCHLCPLGYLGYSQLYLLVHPGEAPLDRTQWETIDRWQSERNPALYPVGQFEGDYLYQVLPPNPQRFTSPLATFGPNQTIRLLAIELELPSTVTPHASRLTFHWQPTTSLPTNYTIFIHLRAPDGFVRSQADGPPVSGHYLTTEWQVGEIIQDVHLLPAEDFFQVDHLAIGLYDPATGERLPAFGPDTPDTPDTPEGTGGTGGERLAEDAVIVEIGSRE